MEWIEPNHWEPAHMRSEYQRKMILMHTMAPSLASTRHGEEFRTSFSENFPALRATYDSRDEPVP